MRRKSRILLYTDLSRRNSMEFGEASRESEFVVLKERRLVPRNAVFDGMLRFSCLLETCQPGSVPDHYLMAAILDLVKIFYFYPILNRFRDLLSKKLLISQEFKIIHDLYKSLYMLPYVAPCTSGRASLFTIRVRPLCSPVQQGTMANVDEIELPHFSPIGAYQ